MSLIWFIQCLIVLAFIAGINSPNDSSTNHFAQEAQFINPIENTYLVVDPMKNLYSYSEPSITFKEFRKAHLTLDLYHEFNFPNNLSSKLAIKLLYYITNGFNPNQRTLVLFKSPLIATPLKLESFNLTLYKSEKITFQITIEENFQIVEIMDFFPSTDQISVHFCKNTSMFKNQNCSEFDYLLNNKTQKLNLSFDIIPKRMGLTSYKLFVLCRINNKFLTVYTIGGSFVVSKSNFFTIVTGQQIILVGKEDVYIHLTLDNRNNEQKNIMNIYSENPFLKVHHPTLFINKNLESEWSLKKYSVEGVQVWSVSPNEKKRFVEVILPKFVQNSQILLNLKTKVFDWEKNYVSRSKVAPVSNTDDVCLYLEKHMQAYEEIPNCPSVLNEYPKDIQEPSFSIFEKNVIQFQVNRLPYAYNIFSVYHEPSQFFDHAFINFGVFCSRKISHDVNVFVSNKFNRPLIVKSLHIINSNPHFSIRFIRFPNEPTILAAKSDKMSLLKLSISFHEPTVHFSVLNAWLIATLEMDGFELTERLELKGFFSSSMIIITEKGEYEISPKMQQHGIMVRQNIAGQLFITKIEVKEGLNNDNVYSIENLFNSPTFADFENFESEYTTRILEFKFRWPQEGFRVFKNEFIVVIHAIENVFSFRLVFYYNILTCCNHVNNDTNWTDCQGNNEINMGIFSKNILKRTYDVGFFNQGLSNMYISMIDFGDRGEFYNVLLLLTTSASNDKKKNSEKKEKITQYRFLNEGKPYKIKDPKHVESHSFVTNIIIPPRTFLNVTFIVEYPNEPTYINSTSDISRKITFYKHDESIFVYQLNFSYLRGNIKSIYQNFRIELFLPGQTISKKVPILSTFGHNISITSAFIKGNGEMVVIPELINTTLKSGINEEPILFLVSPFNLIEKGSYSPPIGNTLEEINSMDVQREHIFKEIWQAMTLNDIINFNCTLIIETNVNYTIQIPIEVNFKQADLKTEFEINGNLIQNKQSTNLKITNPYNQEIEISLFLSPPHFCEMAVISQELISYFQNREQKVLNEVFCLESKLFEVKLLKRYLEIIISNYTSLNYTEHPKRNDNINSVCVKIPKEKNIKSHLKAIFKSIFVSNLETKFFFERNTSQSDEIGEIYQLRDIQNYTKQNDALKKQESKMNWIASSLKSVVGNNSDLNPSESKKMIENIVDLHHIRNYLFYVRHKHLFLNEHLFEKKIKLAPLKTIEIKDAIFFSHDYSSIQKNNATFLILKTSLNSLFFVPIKITENSQELSIIDQEKNVSNAFDGLIDSKEIKNAIANNKPVIREFFIQNTGQNDIVLRNAIFKNRLYRDSCFQLQKIKRKKLKPFEVMSIKVVIYFCTKTNSGYSTEIILKTNYNDFKFPLRVLISEFYVTGNFHPNLSRLVTASHFLLLGIFFVFFWSVLPQTFCNYRPKIVITKKNFNTVFLSTNELKEKIELFNFRVKDKKINTIEFEKVLVQNDRMEQEVDKSQNESKIGHGKEDSFEENMKLSRKFVQLDANSRSEFNPNSVLDKSQQDISMNFQLKRTIIEPDSFLNINKVMYDIQRDFVFDESESLNSKPVVEKECKRKDVEDEKDFQESLQKVFGINPIYKADGGARKYSIGGKEELDRKSEVHQRSKIGVKLAPDQTYKSLLESLKAD